MTGFRFVKSRPALRFFFRIVQSGKLPSKVPATVQFIPQLLRRCREFHSFLLKRGNFVFFAFQRAIGFCAACPGQITLQLLPAPIPAASIRRPPVTALTSPATDVSRSRRERARGVAAVEAGQPLTDPEKA